MKTGYIKQWEAAGHPDGMGSASFLPPPPKGFIRAYYFTLTEYGVRNLEHSRLKLARFSDTNDPFELMGLMLREQTVRRTVKEFKKARNDDTGILCFSANWTNPLLWSHYAEKHRGICLGFDLKREIIHHVSYEEKRLMARLDEPSAIFAIDADLKQRLLLTKSHHWQYEDERRVFISLSKATKEGNLYFRRFDNDLRLVEVILGPRCGLKPAEVWKVAQATNPCAIVFRSRLEFGGFRIIRDGRDLPSIAKALAERPRECA